MSPLFRKQRRAAHPNDRRSQPALETLEARALPSVVPSLANGILSLTADDAPNHVRIVQPSPDQVVVTESDQDVGTFPADQVQLVVFQHGAAVSTFDNETALPAKQLRLFGSPRLGPDELTQTGTLDALLIDDTLTLTGPSGAGFQITGAWTDTTDDNGQGQVSHTFTASGDMLLKTALGDLPFVASDQTPLTVTTAGSLTADFGTVTSFTWSTDQVLNTTDTANPLHRFAGQFGLQLNAGAIQFDIHLGSDLNDLRMPLNSALPYLYCTTSAATAQFGDIIAQVNAAHPLTVIFDPEDPFLAARTNEFTAGASLDGYIPYTPTSILPNLDAQPIYGHLYGTVAVPLSDVPVRLTGTAVFNLDVAGDGQLLQTLQGNSASQLVTGRQSWSDFSQAAPGDFQVGFNGHLESSYAAAGFNLQLAADGSAVYTPGSISLHGTASANLFTSTPLAFLTPAGAVDLAANLDSQGGIGIQAAAGQATIAGYSATNLTVALTNAGATIDAQLDPAYGFGSLAMHGSASANGQFTLIAALSQVVVHGFPLSNVAMTLGNIGLIVVASYDLAGVGPIALVGQILPSGHFALVANNVPATLAGFTLNELTISLRDTGLAVNTWTNIPLLGRVTFGNSFSSPGPLVLTATVARFTVAGFGLDNATVTLAATGLTVAGHANFVNIGDVNFQGTISASGVYQFTSRATLTVAGFSLPNTALTLDGSGVSLAVCASIPRLGSVCFTGSYSQAGRFAFSALVDGPVVVNDVPLGHIRTGLNNEQLSVGSCLDIPGLASACFDGTLDRAGSFQLGARVAAFSLAGFSMSDGTLTLTNNDLKLQAQVNFPILVPINVAGSYAYRTSAFSLTGTANLIVAGFSLPAASLTFNNAGLRRLTSRPNLPVIGPTDLAGSVTPQGQVAMTGTTTCTVAGFRLVNVQLTLNNTAMTISADTTVPNIGSMHLAGTLDSRGQIDMRGSVAPFTVAGFQLTSVNLHLTNTRIDVTGSATVPTAGIVSFAGSVTPAGQLSLNGIAAITVGSFRLPNATFLWTNNGMGITVNFSTSAGTVTLAGSVTTGGQFDLRGGGPLTVVGYRLAANLHLTNTRMDISATSTLPLGGGSATLSGSVTAPEGFNLTGSGTFTVAGYHFSASLHLTSARMDVSTPLIVPYVIDGAVKYSDGIVNLAGSVTSTGQVDMHGSANFVFRPRQRIPPGIRDNETVPWSLSGAAVTLTQQNLTVAGALTIPNVGRVNLSGYVAVTGEHSLQGTVNIALAGFTATDLFTLANTSLTLSARLDLGTIGSITLSGLVSQAGPLSQAGQYTLTGTGSVRFAGFAATGSFTLTSGSTSLTVNSVNVSLGTIGSITMSGSIRPTKEFSLTGTGTVQLAGFTANGTAAGSFTLTSSSSNLAVNRVSVNLGTAGSVVMSGTVRSTGDFTLTGTGSVRFAGFAATGSFTLTTGGPVSVTADVVVPSLATLHLTGSVLTGDRYTLKGNTTTVSFAGFTATTAFTLTQAGLAVATDVDIPNIATVHFTGSILSNGQFTLTGTADVHLAGFLASTAFTLTTTGLIANSTVVIPNLVTGHLTGAIQAGGQFALSGSIRDVRLGGFVADVALTLANAGMTISAVSNIAGVGVVNFLGPVNPSGQYRLTCGQEINIAGFLLRNATWILTNDGMSLSGTTTIPNVGPVALHGSVMPSGQVVLVGTALATVNGFSIGTASFLLTNASMAVTGSTSIANVGTVNWAGSVTPTGPFTLKSTADVRLPGFAAAGAAFTLGDGHMTIYAGVTLPAIGPIHLTGYVQPDNTFALSAFAEFQVLGIGANGSFQLANSGMTTHWSLKPHILGLALTFDGTMTPTGWSLTTVAPLPIGSMAARATFNLSDSGFRATVAGNLDISQNCSGVPVRLTAAVSIGLNIVATENGEVTYAASGTLPGRLQVGDTTSDVTIGFSVDTHALQLRLSAIVVVLPDGSRCQPFSDLMLTY